MSQTMLEPLTKSSDGSGEEFFAHIVKKDGLTDAMVYGGPVEALCGYIWIPSRDPDKFPLCPVCREIAKKIWPKGPPE